MDLNIKELDKADSIIAAAETEDELGTVLRLHLLIEHFLIFYLKQKSKGEISIYAKQPRDFGGKLSLATAFGLPIPLVKVIHQVNVIRNKLAHNPDEPIKTGDIEELARKVNRLADLDNNFSPLERRFVELPVKRPGERLPFGNSDCRIDFLIAVTAFYSFAIQWIVSTELEQ